MQIDGSEHRRFEPKHTSCTLLVFTDDATSRLMQLRFVPSESTRSYLEALEGYLTEHGCLAAFYLDKYLVFRVSDADAVAAGVAGQDMTKFGRALAELNIEILYASSSQNKGRVERANRTLQNHLVKRLHLEGISTIEAATAFMPGFVERNRLRFALPPARPDNLHRPLKLSLSKPGGILDRRSRSPASRSSTVTRRDIRATRPSTGISTSPSIVRSAWMR